VDVAFSPAQLALRAAVREVLAAECPPAALREAVDDPERWRPLWKTATDLGWTSLALLEGDAGPVELVAALEECGYAAAPFPLLSSAGLAAGVLRAGGGHAVQQELADGAVGALAVSAPGARTLAPALRFDGGRLSGRAGSVADASRADLLVALALDATGARLAAVVRPGPGVELFPHEVVEPGRPLADVAFDVVPEAVLPVPADALALPLTAAAAELVGVTQRLLDLGVAFTRTREQFGRPIGSFQGVKHRLADCYVALERARSLVYAAVMLVDDAEADVGARWRAALLAKAAAGEAAGSAARAAVQVHGAVAMTWEYDVHLYLRRAWQSAALLGDSRSLYAAAADLLLEEA
jgi:alkylation response protein AidB-like acyl-CoA dehydrogenase